MDNIVPLWQTAIYILAGIVTIGLVVYGIFRKVYCKGKDDKALEDKISLLEKKYEDLYSDYEILKDDIKEYRSEIKTTLSTIVTNQAKIQEDMAYIRGKMSKRDKTSS